MASQKNFAITPSVSISRSKFKRPCQHKTSFNLGDIVPIYVDADILPGDTVSLDLASLVRMSNPICPIMDNIFIDYYAFFCPNRLLWTDWKKFMGENTSSAGPVLSAPAYPIISIAGNTGLSPNTGSIGDYMGLPVDLNTSGLTLNVSRLPGAAYCTIFSEWFRDQNLVNPITVNTNSGAAGYLGYYVDGSGTTQYVNYRSAPFKAAKVSDYFTRALPFAQKGAPVSLPLGSTADVILKNDSYNGIVPINQSFDVQNFAAMNVKQTSDITLYNSTYSGVKLVTDLSNATAATINQLRFAFQYQKFLEKDALYGSRYWEILKGHFGITAPDASLQRPELLGHFRQHINIDQVLQTTGSNVATPSSNTLGTPGANSVTGKSGHLISKSFVEHGVLMILAVARHDQTYGQGVNRMWSRTERTDFYFPVFANLGAQEIKNKEIYATGVTGASATDDLPFGYQEAWAEYRYKPNLVTGVLKPNVSGNLGFWTLANNFAAAPTLSRSFIEQDRGNLSRALVTGASGPDFIADFYFDATYVRPMPMYSLPGLIDHH